MQKLLFLTCLFIGQHLCAQIPEDALRASWTTPSGTARQQAIGGAMGSLGGEISSNFVNPAGLGLYRTNEIVITPGLRFLLDKSKYLGTNTSGNSLNNFNLGTSGVVTSHMGPNGASNVFSIAVNRTANFSSNIHYKGQNDYSSGSEQYVEEFAGSGYDINGGIASPGLSYGTRMALYTSLVDTATINGNLQVIGQPQKAGLLWQENDLRTSGGITEIALNLATGIEDKWFIGGGLGIPILSYTRTQTFIETDATGNTNNDFESYIYRETYTTRGWGLNGKLGVLFKPDNAWRVGLAIHAPTIFGLTDKIHASMITRTENYTSLKQVSVSSDSLDNIVGIDPPVNSVDYNLYSPWKFILSGSYLFGGDATDIKKQKGFITADLEYVTTRSSRFKPANDDDAEDQSHYFDAVNEGVKNYYKGTLGARLGGELKFNTIMARAGVAYYTSPYRDKELTADRLFLSAGLGYRNKGMFVDLAYVAGFTRDVSFPYRLADKANVFASLKENTGSLIVTLGVKL